MGDIYELNENIEENLEALEDAIDEQNDSDTITLDEPLYHLKLLYSRESLFAKSNESLQKGAFVIVPTRYGRDMAQILGIEQKPSGVKRSDIVEIIRLATENDLNHAKELKEKEKPAFELFKEKAKVHHLDIKLITVHFLTDEPKALFFFSSDNRVDFRELVKDLVAALKMRIELRQIGVRDEARITGGLGVCGRPFCCNSVSDKLKPVSIKMAKDQNLSLNSLKISGQCGRLLCCLSYEFDWYNEERKRLPQEGTKIFYDGTNFKIAEVNPITSMIKMTGEDGRLLEVNSKRFVKEKNNHWKIQ